MTDQLNEDRLISNTDSKERVAKIIREAENKKKKAMQKAVKIIYSDPKKIEEISDQTQLKINNLKLDGHIVEIVQGDRKVKVGTDLFVTMAKGYFSEMLKIQNAMKTKIYEQSQEIKSLKAQIQNIERTRPIQESFDDSQLMREIKTLKSRLAALEDHDE